MAKKISDRKNVTILGRQCSRLLSECLRKGIEVKEVKYVDDTEITLTIKEDQEEKLEKIAGNQYKISTNQVFGPKTAKKKIRNRKGFLIGSIFFIALLYYQNLFICEISIQGCNIVKEKEVQEVLKKAGIAEGNKVKDADIELAKDLLYSEIDQLVWNEIEIKGNLVNVDVVEKINVTPNLSLHTPCNITSKKSGIIEKIIPKNGVAVKAAGDYIREGEIGITGTLFDKNGENKRYTHALGDIYARIPYVFTYNESKEAVLLEETERNLYGMDMTIGAFHMDTASHFVKYDNSKKEKMIICNINSPIPMKLNVVNYKEVKPKTKVRSKKEIQDQVKQKLAMDMRKNIPSNCKILKKDLKFHEEENIIRTTVIVEVLEQIGTETKIVPMD